MRPAIVVLGLLLWAWSPSAAQSAQEILRERDRRYRSQSEEHLAEVVVVGKDGRERRKVWRSYRAGSGGESDRLIRFLSPAEVRGVGYLAHHRKGKEPDEWLYLPSMKRERRLGSRDRDSAFAGTSFSYEDLDLLEFDETRSEATLLRSSVVDGAPVYVIELTPKGPSAYARRVLTMHRDTLSLVNVEYFRRHDRVLVKRLTFGDYKEFDGIRTPTRIVMSDVVNGSRTILLVHEVVFNRPQPRDRYTLHNLLRENDLPAGRVGGPFMRWQSTTSPANVERATDLPGGFNGYVNLRTFGIFGTSDQRATSWATIGIRQTATVGRATVTAAVRLESSSSHEVGPLVFDPADRAPRRSPISIRELSLVVPIVPALDVHVGRFHTTWAASDGYSPADAFFPRDFADPLTEERLPIWAAGIRGEIKGARVELLLAPTTTPWRLPALDDRQSALGSLNISLDERPWTVPRGGFQAARIVRSTSRWDIGAWVRSGVRPAPVLIPETALTVDEPLPAGPVIVQIERRFAKERAAGFSISGEYGGWVVRSEFGIFHSEDEALKSAAIWSFGGSRFVRNGEFSATVASNLVKPVINPLFVFDRALLPCVVMAVHQRPDWGSWTVVWLSTFRTVGGVFTAEATKNLNDALKLTAGADLPHGTAFSPAVAFATGQRLRAGLRWNW